MLKPEVLVDAAQTLFHAGRAFPFAIELLQRYLASGPVEEAPAFKAHYLLGTILEKQGDKTGAAREYRASLSLARNFGLAQQALNRIWSMKMASSLPAAILHNFPRFLPRPLRGALQSVRRGKAVA